MDSIFMFISLPCLETHYDTTRKISRQSDKKQKQTGEINNVEPLTHTSPWTRSSSPITISLLGS